MPTAVLDIPRRFERLIKREAKRAFPREWYAILLGTAAGDHFTVDDLYVPPDLPRFSTPSRVNIQACWYVDAKERGEEERLEIIGDVHSHPYRYQETGGAIQGRVQGEIDLEGQAGWARIAGICTVQEVKRGRGMVLRASLRFWGPSVALEVRWTEGENVLD